MLLGDFQSCVILCLTDYLGYIIISEKTYSTVQVAALLGITPATLHRWIREKQIEPPPLQSLAGMEVRVWNKKHLEEVRKYKDEHYWGRGIKKPRQKKQRK
jgi:hypothetical protein